VPVDSNLKTTRSVSKLIAFLLTAGAMVATSLAAHHPPDSSPSRWVSRGGVQDNGCADCHSKLEGKIVDLYARSVHARAGITCDRCHGGELFTADKTKGHSGRFIGQPTSNQAVTMCGTCHRAQAAVYKGSRHFPERRGSPRVDCVQCHGAHTVGAPDRHFSFAYFCSGCHGQEYLPELPGFFPRVLALMDSLEDTQREAEAAGRTLSEDYIQRRKEARRMAAEIVHATDLGGSVEKAPAILKLGDELKAISDGVKK
jgi:hypothetical protein